MKRTLITAMIAAVTVLAISCTKETPETVNNTGGTPNNNDQPNLNDADGAFYSTVVYDEFEGPINQDSGNVSVSAWFGEFLKSQDAGTVTWNSEELERFAQGDSAMYENYLGFSKVNNTVVWNVFGSSKVAPFTDSDNSSYPYITNISIPATVKKTETLRISANGLNGGDYSSLFCRVYFDSVGVEKELPMGNGKTFEFTPTELSKVYDAATFGHVNIYLIGLRYDKKIKNSKTYYFIKETEYMYSRTLN